MLKTLPSQILTFIKTKRRVIVTAIRLKAFCVFFISMSTQAQTDSSVWETKPEIATGGFIDVYYAYDFNLPKTNERQSFLYNHNRHNETNINLAFLKASVKHSKYRANIAIQTGTYVNDNYINEPEVLKHAHEANIGISLNGNNNLWLDVGIFNSHIGFEGAVSISNWTLTRSLLAENSPYYLSGAKLTYSSKNNWEYSALVLNGWQRIQRLEGNSLPSFGTQVKFSSSERLTFNWSTFVGTDSPDSTRKMRYFNNLFYIYQITPQLGFIAGFDIGFQQVAKNENIYNCWYSPALITKYSINKKFSTALRAEYYRDVAGVIVNYLHAPFGFHTTGISINFDYNPVKNMALRIEGRNFLSSDNIFLKNNKLVQYNNFVVSSLSISF